MPSILVVPTLIEELNEIIDSAYICIDYVFNFLRITFTGGSNRVYSRDIVGEPPPLCAAFVSLPPTYVIAASFPD
jgi:hypothetical protein